MEGQFGGAHEVAFQCQAYDAGSVGPVVRNPSKLSYYSED